MAGTSPAMTKSHMARVPLSTFSRRLLAGGIEPGIDAALETCERFQALLVHERQQLHQDYAGDVARGVDPEEGVGEPCPGEAGGAAAFRSLGGVDQERESPFLHHVRIEVNVVGIVR